MEFLQLLAALPFATPLALRELRGLAESLPSTEPMPVLFLGHGSPMNAIEDNAFTRGFRTIAGTLPAPAAVLCVSAHWETPGSFVTAMPQPRTIHDFGGFPPALYQVQYPAPGAPAVAEEMRGMLGASTLGLDTSWGLDHGCWSVLIHMFPDATVPVLQLSLDYTASPEAHYALARRLAPLRRKGILIVGSGNMVHNLRRVAWDRLGEAGFGFDWAVEAGEWMKAAIRARDHAALQRYATQSEAVKLAVPTPEHFLPLLYTLALQEEGEEAALFNDEYVAGALTMTSLRIGPKSGG